MKTLLERVKEIKATPTRKLPITDEQIDVAISWLKDEITLSQINKATGNVSTSANGLYRMAVWLREAYRREKLVEK